MFAQFGTQSARTYERDAQLGTRIIRIYGGRVR